MRNKKQKKEEGKKGKKNSRTLDIHDRIYIKSKHQSFPMKAGSSG
jgi:hypothetical protein